MESKLPGGYDNTLPNSKIIFLSMNNSLDVVQVALSAGRSRFMSIRQAPRVTFCLLSTRFLRGEQFVSSTLRVYKLTDTPGQKAPHCHEVLFYSDDGGFF